MGLVASLLGGIQVVLTPTRQKRGASEKVPPPKPPTTGRWTRPVIAVAVLAIYALAFPSASRGKIEDIEATSIPAWHFVETGSWDLSTQERGNLWFVETDRGLRSNRTPGLIASATFGYALTAPFTDGFEDWPGTAVAVVTAWLAVLVVAATADRLKKGLWLPAVVLFGLGTATWSVSSGQLWPHAPVQLTIAIAVYYLARERNLTAGLALGVGVIMRPAVILFGFGLAVIKGVQERSWRPVLTIGGPSALAALVFVAYNQVLFGSWSPLAGYDAVGGLWYEEGLVGSIGNIGTAFFGRYNGVLLWSAWIPVCFVLFLMKPKSGPAWMRYTPLLAVAFIVVHSTMEVASGGLTYNYRYPLEAVTLAAPALLLALPLRLEGWARSALVVTGAFAVFLNGALVFFSACGPNQLGDFTCRIFG